MKRLLLPLLVALGGCDDVLITVGACPSPSDCTVDREGNVILDSTSACGTGYTSCDDEGRTVCLGFVRCTPEVCDGLDNDGDGDIDEGLGRLPYNPAVYGPICAPFQRGACHASTVKCVGGVFVCAPDVTPSDEVCDGQDNDCDGEEDNGITAEFFYPDDVYPDTSVHGICRPGVTFCEDGRTVRREPVTPQTEVCGDGLDNDCDGTTDEPAGSLDVIFIVDVSGSMYFELGDVLNASCAVARRLDTPTSRFSLVSFGDDNGDPVSHSRFLTPFLTASEYCDSRSLALFFTSQSAEYGPEAGSRAIEDADWAADNRHVVIVTDEPPQAPFGTPLSEAMGRLIEVCSAEGVVIHAWTDLVYSAGWEDVEVACGAIPTRQYTDLSRTSELVAEFPCR